MSTIAIVKKNGVAVIAADTLTTWGRTKESAEYVVNCEKIFKFKENFLGFTGSASFQMAVEEILLKTKKRFCFDNKEGLFQIGQFLHAQLKEKYYLRADDDESFETSRGDILIANPYGIFGISSYRYVQEYKKFYAHGSGCEYALGSMFATYDDEDKTAENIAVLGVSAGIEFDDASGSPLTCLKVKMKE